jgi:hypothetical protein
MISHSQNQVNQISLNYSKDFNMSSSFLNDSTNDTQVYKELVNAIDFNLSLGDLEINTKDPSSDGKIEDLLKSNHLSIDTNLFGILAGNFTNFAKSSRGSHFLQMTMINSNEIIISKIFQEIKYDLPSLLVNTYSNYFCKYFYTLLTTKDKLEYLEAISFSFTSIAKNNKGTYALQYIIEKIETEEEFKILSDSIQNHATFTNLIGEKNSIHVLEKIILKMPDEKYLTKPLVFIFSNFKNICRNKLKMRLVLALLKRNVERKKIIYHVVQNFETLINDKVGYYILYYIIEVLIY